MTIKTDGENSGAIVRVLEMIHEDIKGLRQSHEHMEKTLIQITAQELAPRIRDLEQKAHDYEVALAGLDPVSVKKQLHELRDGQVKLLVKISAIGGGAGLAGGGLLYWILQLIQAPP